MVMQESVALDVEQESHSGYNRKSTVIVAGAAQEGDQESYFGY